MLRNTDVDIVYTPYNEFYKIKNSYILKDFFPNNLQGKYNIENVINKTSHYLNMYTLCYKTEILRTCQLRLLEKCFYTDTQYAMYPIVKCETIYISHEPIYMYRLGGEEQSVSLQGYIKHYEDHVKVSKDIIKFYNTSDIKNDIQDYLLKYVVSHVANTISGFYMVLEVDKQNLEKIKDFDRYVLENNKLIYDKMENKSKIVKILRETDYNFIFYMIMAKLKRRKMQNRYK